MMDDTALDEVTEWETRSVGDGYDGLRSLADGGFSGVVEAGRASAHFVNGRILHVAGGRIDSFEGSPLTAYVAPEAPVAMLMAMQAADSEVRAQYFTDDKPIAQANAELSNAGFTGYVALSENVLSGDYYVVYQGGTSSAIAWVGSSRRLLTGDDAFDRADEEVGIYKVHDVDLEVIDVPGPETRATPGGSTDEEDAPAPGPQSDANDTGPDGASTDPVGAGDPPSGRPETDGQSVDAATGEQVEDSAHTEFDDGAGLDFDADDTPVHEGGPDATDPGRDDDPYGLGADLGPADGGADEEPASGGEDDYGLDLEGSLTGDAPPSDTGSRPESESDDSGTEPDTPDAEGVPEADTTPGGRPDAGADPDAGESDALPSGSEAALGDGPPTGDAKPSDGSAEVPDAGVAGDVPTAEGDPTDDADTTAGPDAGDTARDPADRSAVGSADRFSAEEQWREDRAIPALDPDESATAADSPTDPRPTPSGPRPGEAESDPDSPGSDAEAEPDPGASGEDDRPGRHSDAQRTTGPDPDVPSEASADDTAAAGPDRDATSDPSGDQGQAGGADRSPPDRETDTPGRSGVDAPSREALRERLAAAETAKAEAETARDEAQAARESAEQRLAELRESAESLARERDEYRERASELSSRVEELEAEVDRLRSETDRLERELETARQRIDDGPDGERVDAAAALRGAHVMIRYNRAGGATLAKARDGEVDREEVNSNLQLEYHHTRFETEDAVVDGETFEEFLTTTTEYRFVQWLVRQLVYDIAQTGNAEALDRLYDAIPEANRAEFDGGVTVPVGEDGEGHESKSFDVVIRDRMGNPLVVADMNKTRDAATDDQMADLVEKARAVGRHKEALAGAFLVTASFFDPAALETADAATDSGGLIRGSSRRSFVKLSRGTGFHLLLVETRRGSFHVNVPEL
jgi:hypothetical protein